MLVSGRVIQTQSPKSCPAGDESQSPSSPFSPSPFSCRCYSRKIRHWSGLSAPRRWQAMGTDSSSSETGIFAFVHQLKSVSSKSLGQDGRPRSAVMTCQKCTQIDDSFLNSMRVALRCTCALHLWCCSSSKSNCRSLQRLSQFGSIIPYIRVLNLLIWWWLVQCLDIQSPFSSPTERQDWCEWVPEISAEPIKEMALGVQTPILTRY